MAWYRAGTVSVTNNSSAVLGAGTAWVTGAEIGETFLGPDGQSYEIVAINSATSLTIAPVYKGSTASAQSYAIMPTQGYLRDLAAAAAALVESYSSVKNNAGTGKFAAGTSTTPSLRNAADENTGLNLKGSDQLALVTAGVERLALSASGVPSGTAVTHMLDRTNHTGAQAISTVTGLQIVLDAKAPLASPTFTGTVVVPDNSFDLTKLKYVTRASRAGLTTGATWISHAEDPLQSEVEGANVTSVLLSNTGSFFGRRNKALMWSLTFDGGMQLNGPGLKLNNSALSSDANTLDFYEEGTFTPTLAGLTTAGTSTYTSRDGKYTRIGNTVYWSLSFITSSFSGAAGNVVITGLPFTAGSSPSARGGVSIGWFAGFATTLVGLYGAHRVGTSQISLIKMASANTATTQVQPSDIGTALDISMSGFYNV